MFIEPRKPVTVDELHARHDRAVRQRRVRSRSPSSSPAARRRSSQMMNREAQRLGMKNTHFVNVDRAARIRSTTRRAHDLARSPPR